MFGKSPGPKKPFPDYYFEISLEPELMVALGDLLEGKKVPGRAIERLKTAWLCGRRVKLPYARLDWDNLQSTAKEQGCSEADVFFDRAGQKGSNG